MRAFASLPSAQWFQQRQRAIEYCVANFIPWDGSKCKPLKAETLRNRKEYEETVRADMERRRRLHDGVRKAETDGFGDTRVFAYSSVMHSGTSLWSQTSYSREEGQRRRRFRHDLPNPKSPSGRWLRDYANHVLSARTSRSSPQTDSLVSI